MLEQHINLASDHKCLISNFMQLKSLQASLNPIIVPATALVDYRILVVVHLKNLVARRGLFRFLVRPDSFKPRKPQPDAPPGVSGLIDRALVRRRLRQIGRLHLPHPDGVEPDVASQSVGYDVLRALFGDDVVLEIGREGLEIFLGKSCADLAHALELLGVVIVTGQEVGAVQSRALSLAVV